MNRQYSLFTASVLARLTYKCILYIHYLDKLSCQSGPIFDIYPLDNWFQVFCSGKCLCVYMCTANRKSWGRKDYGEELII